MSKLDRQALVTAVSKALKAAGFTKRGDSWYLDTADAVQVVNLQKSTRGDQHYINLAIWVKALGDNPHPREHEGHVRIRLTSLPGVDRGALEQALNLEIAATDLDAKAKVVEEGLIRHALPFLRSLGTLDGLTTAIRNGQLESAIVDKAVRELVETRAS
jgi:hypothetical protein